MRKEKTEKVEKQDSTASLAEDSPAEPSPEEAPPEPIPAAVVEGYRSTDSHAELIGLKKAIDELTQDRERERDLRLRVAAEYDNYRRRTQLEMAALSQLANERLILKLLPVVDDFGRFLSQNLEATEVKTLAQGVELIARKFEEALTSEGVQPIRALGQPFDALVHEAIARIEDPAKPGGLVLIEVERGYRLGDKIIRHSKVVVNDLTEKEEAAKAQHD